MAKQNVWLSVSDLMTGLMIIFLFIAISYIKQVQDHVSDISDYVEVKQNLHDKLVREFKGDTARWVMSIGKDLSMKFNNSKVQFAQGSWDISPNFKNTLDEFLPRYFNILLNDTLRYHITEVRIEGHTDNVPYPRLNSDPYLANVILSQRRSLAVLEYFRNMNYYKDLSDDKKEMLEFWFTANGLSYGKALDVSGNYFFFQKDKIDLDRSRRVEFRIITDSEKLLENFVSKVNKE